MMAKHYLSTMRSLMADVLANQANCVLFLALFLFDLFLELALLVDFLLDPALLVLLLFFVFLSLNLKGLGSGFAELRQVVV